jgi:hypothetical protein
MIILECIAEKKNKLRIRFHSYVDDSGKCYMNVYNNKYNCQFPKDIREEGFFYQIPDNDMSIINDGYRTPFYKVNKKNIRILTSEEASIYKNNDKSTNISEQSLKLYEVADCVICLTDPSSIILIPCAHMALCRNCYNCLMKTNNKCPLCRKNILNIIEHMENVEHKEDIKNIEYKEDMKNKENV